MDYGNSALLLPTDLVDIPNDLLKLPALCAPCALRGVVRPRSDISQILSDIVNAEVAVRCHEIDSTGAIPTMIVSLVVDGSDVALSLRNEGYLELAEDEIRNAGPTNKPSTSATVVDLNNNVVDLNNNVVDLNNNVVDLNNNVVDLNNNVEANPAVAASTNPKLAPVEDQTVVATNEDYRSLKDENHSLKERLAEMEKKNAEASKKIEEMAKKMDVLKSLI